MVHILRELRKDYGAYPSLVVKYNKKGVDRYDPNSDTIYLFPANYRTHAESVFTLIHEYRHALQVAHRLFPDMLDMEKFHFIHKHTEHYDVPWEREANDWAWRQGLKMGFWDNQWKPDILLGRHVGDLK